MRTFYSFVPCEKLRRKTSTPEVRRRWMVSSSLQDGPTVARIFVRRILFSSSRAQRRIFGGTAMRVRREVRLACVLALPP